MDETRTNHAETISLEIWDDPEAAELEEIPAEVHGQAWEVAQRVVQRIYTDAGYDVRVEQAR